MYTLTTDATTGKPVYTFSDDCKLTEIDSKVARVEFIRHKMATNDEWLVRGLKAIYRNQTEDEQHDKATTDRNGIGFNGTDAEFLSSIAEKACKGWTLSPKQLAATRKAMRKYAGQLERIATGC
ncbi:MAG: hypothetical protein ACKO0Z_05045 [Betaproteobacteria bacterium]